MFHRLCVGHFEENDILSCRDLSVTKPLDLDKVLSVVREMGLESDGERFCVGKDAITIEDGYIDCPWLTPWPNQKSVEFMIRLHKETGCMFVELSRWEIVSLENLQESLS